ncbi:MAG: MBL fold metallo-hydrolase [Bryobacterales bacterium]|nr:MBL fold metallo-hydrolase [Bryobacterales bacterium]
MLPRRSFLASPLALLAKDGAPDSWELPVDGMARLSRTVWVKLLTTGVWITCFTFDTPNLGWIPCNGLIIATEAGPVIVDTGNNQEQGELLLATAKRLTGRAATQGIATHFHTDRTGGIEALRAAGVPTLAHPFSVGLAQAYGFPVPQPVKGLEKGPVKVGDLELFYPGVGHARDNITVWHEATGVLFGGCLLRSTTDKAMGNLADGDLAAFPETISRLAARYPKRRFTIPGHGSASGDAVEWTRELLAAQRLRVNTK